MFSLICRLVGHRRDRNQVWHDGVARRTCCRRCGAQLVRGIAGWRPYRSDRDARADRRSDPRSSTAG